MNGRDLTLGALAGLAVAGMVAQRRRTSRRGGLNRAANVTHPLWIGTTRRNLPGILARGVVPSGGWSPHRTDTRSAVFLTGDPEAALLYADGSLRHIKDRFQSDAAWVSRVFRTVSPDEPVLLKINVRGLPLLPDYDDISSAISSYLGELSEKVGEDVEPGVPLGDLEDAVYDAIEAVHEQRERGGVFGVIENEGEERVLALVPIHDLPVDTRASNSHHDLYDRFSIWDEDGNPHWETTQYQYAGTIPTDRIEGIYLLERSARDPDLTLPSYGYLMWPLQYNTSREAREAGAKVDFLNRKFHRYTVAEAKRLRK